MSEKPKTVEERLVAIEKAVTELTKTHNEEAPFTAASRQERMSKVLSEWSEKKEKEDMEKIKQWDEARAKTFDEKFAIYKAETEKTDEEVLRRYLGVNKDEPLKMSDLPKMVGILRKAILEHADTDKRTPAPAGGPQSAGPEGTATLTPLEKAVQEFEASGGATK